MILTNIVSGKRYKFIFKCIRANNNFFVIQYLRDSNNISILDENDESIFMNIIKYGTNDMLKFFMNRYPDYNLDEYDQSNIHALFYLIKKKDLDIDYIRSFLIRCNRDINIWSEQYGSLLFHSIYYKNMEGFTLLLSMGVDVNGLDNRQNPLIYYCVLNGFIEVSNTIINHPYFNVDNTNTSNESILEVAIIKCMALHAKLIFSKKPKVLKDKDTVIKLMDYSIDSRNTIMAWQLYQNYCAYIIQKALKKYIYKKKNKC
tara:strand:- start:43 stop:819 length:777 start_codon:yes stop_codon:yes gene_type:complete